MTLRQFKELIEQRIESNPEMLDEEIVIKRRKHGYMEPHMSPVEDTMYIAWKHDDVQVPKKLYNVLVIREGPWR